MFVRCLLVFILIAFASMQIVIFEDEYGKSLSAHYFELQRTIELFQRDADKYFGGDMQALISHYKHSSDSIFRDGGSNIEAMYVRYLLLKEAAEGFRRGRLTQIWQIIFHPIQDVRSEVRDRFTFAVRLEGQLPYFSLVGGLIGMVLVEVVWSFILMIFRGKKKFHIVLSE